MSVEEIKPEGRAGSIIHTRLHLLGERLQSPEGRRAILRGCLRWIRIALRWTTLAYVFLLLLLCVLMRCVGERNVFFAFCLYLPPLIWYLPALILLPLCALAIEWRGLLLGAAGLAVTLVVFWGYKPGGATPMPPVAERAAHRQLVILTNNRGQHGGHSMKPFKDLVRPDVMAFQEAAGASSRYLADPYYAELTHGRDIGEFSLISKYPILSAEPVVMSVPSLRASSASEDQNSRAQEQFVVAARFEIDFFSTPVVIYNVHLPSPRGTIQYYMRGAFIYGLVGIPGTPMGGKRRALQAGWDQRIELVRRLMDRVAKESKPTILAGDFNMPNIGFCHTQVAASFRDSHTESGSGFGFTFPGTTHNPLAFGGPWMRIDYVFGDAQHWRFVASTAEEDRASQHRASAACISLEVPDVKKD